MFLSLDACEAYQAVSENGTWEQSIYQFLQHIPVFTNAVWVSQSWECVQQDAGHGHEVSGEGLLDILT